MCLFLQAPLQPLQDNLESQTYETFEKDVTKYQCYQAAVKAALLDRVPEDKAADTVVTLMVVGAGTWKLVHATCYTSYAILLQMNVILRI